MRRLFCLILFFSVCLANATEFRKKHAISYQGGDRFGDRLLVYAQARYLSYITSVPFLYRPFIYSDQVTIDCEAELFSQQEGMFQNIVIINSGKRLADFFHWIDDPQQQPTLFILDYLPTDISEWDSDLARSLLFHIAWGEQGFHAYLQRVTSPRIPIPNLRREGMLNVADHVRTLSGHDTPETSIAHLPLKHPNLTYHYNQIRKVHYLNKQRPMYVFIFSDTKTPQKLIEKFRAEFAGENIEFGIQILDNPDTNYAVQDFFAMQKFDVLISTQSNFSMMASRIGSFDMVIAPVHLRGSYPTTEIDRVQIISQRSDWFPHELNIIIREN